MVAVKLFMYALQSLTERILIAKWKYYTFWWLLDNSLCFFFYREDCRECHIYYPEQWEVRFLQHPFNIALAIARTKALYRSAWNGTGSGCSSVPCNAACTLDASTCVWMRACRQYIALPIWHTAAVAGNSDDIVPYLRIRDAVLRGLD